jgi:hypothetical protein
MLRELFAFEVSSGDGGVRRGTSRGRRRRRRRRRES